MGNVFSINNCFSSKNRPTSIFGKRKKQPICEIYTMNIITPLSTDYPAQLTPIEVNELLQNRTITYNNDLPHLITSSRSSSSSC